MRGAIAGALLTLSCLIAGAGTAAPVASQRSPQVVAFEQVIAEAKSTMLTDPTMAGTQADRALRQADAITDAQDRGIAVATAQWLRGESYLRRNQPRSADAPTSAALSSAARLVPGSKLHADVLLSRGGVDSGLGDVAAALKHYQASFDIYRKLSDERGQAMALIFIALLYSDAMDQPTALRYYSQALETYRTDPSLSVSIYHNRGVAYRELHQYDAAEKQFAMALALAKKLDGKLLEASVLNSVGKLKMAQGDARSASDALSLGLKLAAEPGGASIRTQLLASSAQAALQSNDPRRAVALVEQAFRGVDLTKTSLLLRDSHQTAYDTFRAAGDDKAALAHLQAMKRLDDDATKLATTTSTALMGARFDFANQELKITQLKATELERSVAYERARATTLRTVFIGASGAVAIIIGMLVFALVTSRRSRDKVRAANDDLAVTNSALGKALAAKTEFLATTSHEIRTPLNGILGMTQVMLADAQLSGDLRDRIGVVHGAGVTMRALVDDILDVAKMETGNLTIEHAPFDLRASVTDATRLWEEQARAKGLDFAVDLTGCPAMVMGDAARVRQIVFNLLSNALKFTRAGSVSLVAGERDGRIRIAVIDSGIGIPADKLDEIFESFRQADAGTTRQFGGTGLGLSICRNLARAMGGDVCVVSRMGEGATFTLVLPLEHAAVAARPAAGVTDTSPATLIVDRNPITRSMLKTLMAPHGGPVEFATSGEEAVARLGACVVGHVLIDDTTIRASGDVLAVLRSIAIAAKAAETTLLWPLTAEVERDGLLATGITRVVAKPVSGAALVQTMFGDSVAEKHVFPDLVSRAA